LLVTRERIRGGWSTRCAVQIDVLPIFTFTSLNSGTYLVSSCTCSTFRLSTCVRCHYCHCFNWAIVLSDRCWRCQQRSVYCG